MDNPTLLLEIRMVKCTKTDLDEAQMHKDYLRKGWGYYLIGRRGVKTVTVRGPVSLKSG